MIARVCPVILDAASFGSRFNVSGSTSAKTTRPPASMTAFAAETNVNDGQITSSPGASGSARIISSSAWVPEDVVKAWLHPSVRRAAAASTWLAAPSPTSSPLFNALPTISLSASSKGVRCSGIAYVTGSVPCAMSEILYHVDSRPVPRPGLFPSTARGVPTARALHPFGALEGEDEMSPEHRQRAEGAREKGPHGVVPRPPRWRPQEA